MRGESCQQFADAGYGINGKRCFNINPIKYLKSKKGRQDLNQFLVEGEKSVQEIPDSWTVSYFVSAERYAEKNDLSVYRQRAPVMVMRDPIFDAACDTVTPQGILAVCEQKTYALESVVKPGNFLLMGECLSDPGNIGALIRSAAAAGADGVILSQGSGELYNPKVLRAAAGAALRIPVVTDADIKTAVKTLRENDVAVYAAHLRGDTLPYDLDLRGGVCFLVGNEAHGLSNTAAELASALVRLPMPGGTESLNASVAGGILLYEAVRQRMGK